LRRVSGGENFAFIGTVPTIAYAIKEHSLYNIKIAGRLEENRAVSVAAAPENQELLTVVEKGLQGMNLEARRRAVDRWISISLEEQVDRTTLWLILAAVLVAGALAAAWIRKTQSYNRKLSTAYTLLEKKNRELAELSITDRLTGLFNRTKLDGELQREVARSNRYEAPLSIIMIDVDWFKQINDELGHQVGDQVLQEIADVLSRRVRTADILGRWGGEEFLVICPETTRTGACELAEDLRRAVADELVGSSRPVTISLGVSQHSPGTTAGDAIRRTDERLYRAKETGKNTVQAE
jgi:polar amino acid transport system substrate-binding protein